MIPRDLMLVVKSARSNISLRPEEASRSFKMHNPTGGKRNEAKEAITTTFQSFPFADRILKFEDIFESSQK